MTNPLIEKQIISEMQCGVNFAYILEDSGRFLPTEYKVLQNQTNGCFVRCIKMLFNGKVQLYYLTGEYKPLSKLLRSLDADRFMTVISNLLAAIINVKSIGFLSCQNIDLSFEHIFVDPTTYKVNLIYLPLDKKIYEDYPSFENELRTELVKLTTVLPIFTSPKTSCLSADLSDGTLSLEDVYNRLAGGGQKSCVCSLRLTAMDAPFPLEINVTKDNFVIGRKAEAVDGAVTFNRMIGRLHCRINKLGEQYTVTDLQSSNGTFVNGVRLLPNRPYQIKQDDVIRLANSNFRVNIVREGAI